MSYTIFNGLKLKGIRHEDVYYMYINISQMSKNIHQKKKKIKTEPEPEPEPETKMILGGWWQ